MEQAFKLISEAQLFSTASGDGSSGVQCAETGGGSHKYGQLFDQFGLRNRRRVDEMKALVTGLNYLLTHLHDECFYYVPPELYSPPLRPIDSDNGHAQQPKRLYIDLTAESSPFPYLLVNIGTGVSILKVDGDGSYERISGSGLGGGSYWGLARLLTQAKTFDESLQLSTKGKTKNVDMTVGDIYGGDYASLGLPADMTASFFAKFTSRDDEHLRDNVSDADICRGLLLMTTNNIGQIAFLLAKLHNVKQILFSGSFLRHSSHVDIASVALSKAIAFWSNNEMRALFLRHEGYFGALVFLIIHLLILCDET